MSGPVEQEEDGSVYECMKANQQKLKAAKEKGKIGCDSFDFATSLLLSRLFKESH